MSELKDLITIRNYIPEFDKNFIFSTWKKSIYFGNKYLRDIPEDHFFEKFELLIKSILDKPEMTIKVACLKEDISVILGYSVYESELFHFIFIKLMWRGLGISKLLLPESIQAVTQMNHCGETLKQKHFPDASYAPFIIGTL
jgi:hypothetical protein